MGKGLKEAWCRVTLMKTVDSLSGAVEEEEEAEEEVSSTSGRGKQQLNQRRETEETSAAASAPAKEEGASSTAESLVSAEPVHACRADGYKNKDGTVSEVKEVIQSETCRRESFECPEDPSATTFSRKSTAAFSSRGNTCRFVVAAPGACEDEEAAEGRLQKLFNFTGSADGSETTIWAAATQQQQVGPGTDSTVASGQKGPHEHWNDAQWKKGTPSKSAVEDQTLVEEVDGQECPIWKTPDQSVHTATRQPVREVVCREQHSVDATSSSPTDGATLRKSHSRSCQSNHFAALQASSCRHSDSPRAALSPKVCAVKHGDERHVENGDFQREECRGAEANAEDEKEEKSAFLTEGRQIKRSASDGTPTNFGMWRINDDVRGRISTELDPDCLREEAAVEGRPLLTMDCHQGNCSNSSKPGGKTTVDCPEKQKWDQKSPLVSRAVPQWDASSRRDHRTLESPKRGDIHIINSLSSLARGASTARERRGRLEREAVGDRGFGVGGFCHRSSQLGTKSPPKEKLSATTDSEPHTTGTEWGRNGRHGSAIGTKSVVQAASPRSFATKDMCPAGRRSLVVSEEYTNSKGRELRTRVDTATAPSGTESDDPSHSLKTTRTSISFFSFPRNQGDNQKAAQESTPNSKDPQHRCGDVDKPNDTMCWKDSTRVSPLSNGDDGRWDIVESNSPGFSDWSSGRKWEAAKTVIPCSEAAENSRQEGLTTGAEKAVYTERGEAPVPRSRCRPGKESEGTRLVRELVEEFDKRRTNFSILVPKVLELVGVLMGRPAGTQLPCVFPRNFSPAVSLRRPCPLPVCATFSEMGQTCTVEKLERYFPTFNIEGGLLLCTQVLKQVSRSKHSSVEPEGNQAFKLPAAATSGEAASGQSPVLPAARISLPRCDSGRIPDDGEQQDERKGGPAQAVAWGTGASSLGSPRLLRSLLDPLPPADALLQEAQSTQEASSPGSTSGEFGERSHELGSTSTSTSSSRGAPTLREQLESPTTKRKTVGGHDFGGKGGLSPQGAKLTRRSGSYTSGPMNNQSSEERLGRAERLRRAVTTNLATFANSHSFADQTHLPPANTSASSLRGTPTPKREAEIWEFVSDLTRATRETKQLDDFLKRASTNADRGQQPSSAPLRPKEPGGSSACAEGVGAESRVEPSRETRWRQEGEGDGLKSAGTSSPALSSSASSASRASSALHGNPWWGGGELHSRRLGKSGAISVVRSSNPQRLVRVYRSLVVEDKTHVVERLLRVWSMTLHARTSQSPHGDEGMCRSSSPLAQEKVTEKKLPSRKNRQTALNEETDEKDMSPGEGATEEELEESGAPQTQEIGNIPTDEGECSSQLQCRENRRGSLLSSGDAASGKVAHVRAGGRTPASAVPDTFLLRKSNTTDCGRILSSGKTAEKFPGGLIQGREDRRRQSVYEGGADSSKGQRWSRLRRASTSARGDFKVERHFTRYRGSEEQAQDELVRSSSSALLASPCNHTAGQPLLSTKQNETGHGASPSNFESVCELMEESDAFLWRPCMSVLWVKPLTVEQTMLKWSKSTPLFEPVEDLAAECRGKRVPAATMRHEGVTSVGNPPLSMILRSAPKKAEVFSTAPDTLEASYSGKHVGKKTSLLNSCSPDSVQSEPSTAADCTSSLPTSPLFAQAPVIPGVGKIDQQPHPQQAIAPTRVQAAPQAVEPSPASVTLLQAIQQQLLQLLQPVPGGRTEHEAPKRVPTTAVQQMPSKEESCSASRTDRVSSNTSVHSKELSLALKLGRANGGPRRSYTWTALESHSASGLLADDATRSPALEDFIAEQNSGYEISPQSTTAGAQGRGMLRAATSELQYSSSESAGVCTIPLAVGRATDNSCKSGMPNTRRSDICPFVAPGITHQSHRCISTFENTYLDDDSQILERSAAPAQEKGCAGAVAHCDEASAPSRRRSDGGQLKLPCVPNDEDHVPVAVFAGPAGCVRQRERQGIGEAGPTQCEIRRASERLPQILKGASHQKSPEQQQTHDSPRVRKQAPHSSSETTGSAADLAGATDASKTVASQQLTLFGSDLDSLGLISRLLGLSVKARSAEEKDHTAPTQELNNAVKGTLAAQTAHAFAALLSCQGNLFQRAKPDNGIGVELLPSVVGSQPEDQGLPSDHGMDHSRRSGQCSRKRCLDVVEVQKQEEREAEDWKKVTDFQISLSAAAHSVERTHEGATELLQQYCSASATKVSPLTQRQKKTKWHFDDTPPVNMEAVDALDRERSSEAQECVTDYPAAALGGEFVEETCKNEERRLTCGTPLNAHEGLLDLLFTQVLQHTSNPTNASVKDLNE